MQIQIDWSSDVKSRFPDLAVCIGTIDTVHAEKDNEEVRKLKKAIYDAMRAEYTVEALKDNPTVRAFRDFYWKLNIDPTKTRPSGEALLRRVLHGQDLPTISTVVDAYNLASMQTIIPISGFERDLLNPPFHVRFAQENEPFTGIGMTEPIRLNNNILVLTDQTRVLCVYPYRDTDITKINLNTRNVLVVGYGAPSITRNQLQQSVEITLTFIKQVAGGMNKTTRVFSATS